MVHPRQLKWLLALAFLACEADVITQDEWDSLSYSTVARWASVEEFDQYEQRLTEVGPTVTAGCEPIHHTGPMTEPGCDVDDPPPNTGEAVLPHGDHYVLLRDGRVFTCADAEGAGAHLSDLDPIPDELTTYSYETRMLLRGDRLVVTAYLDDYPDIQGHTALSLIEVDAQGALSLVGLTLVEWGGTWMLDSSAAWAPDGALALFGSIMVPENFGTLLEYPRQRRWAAGTGLTRSERFVPVTSVARPIQHGTAQRLAVGLRCDVLAEPFACSGQGVVAPQSGTRLDTAEAVYLWGTPEILTDNAGPLSIHDTSSHSAVYRIPLDGSPITAARVRGAMIWWGAMRLQGSDLEILVADNGYPDAEAVALFGPDRVAWLRLPLASLTVEAAEVPASQYQPLAGEACDHTTWETLP